MFCRPVCLRNLPGRVLRYGCRLLTSVPKGDNPFQLPSTPVNEKAVRIKEKTPRNTVSSVANCVLLP